MTAMEPQVQYVTTTDGVSIAYSTLGDGEPLVYMAGGPWSHIELWEIPACQDWYRRLARTSKLVRYDVRGTGWSEREVADYSLGALARDVEAVVRGLGLSRFALLAAADAGPVAIRYAACHPEQVSHLVLWCSWARTAEIASPRIAAWLGLLHEDWEFMTDTCAHLALGWSASEIGRQAARRLRERVTPEAAEVSLRAIGNFDVTHILSHLSMPALVVHRRDVSWIPAAVPYDLASGMPNAHLILLDGESTAPYLGDSEAAASAIDAFLRDGGPERQGDRADRSGSGVQPPRSGRRRRHPDGLTTREVEVLRLLAAGSTNAEIAATLSVSVRTVERHVSNLYAKIGARGRANATAYALVHDLI